MRSNTLAALPLALLLASPLAAQLRINELSLDPTGPNTGQQVVELINVSGAPFTAPPAWTFCIRPTYLSLPPVTIPAGGIVRVHIGAAGIDTATDWFLPFVLELPVDGELALFTTNLFFTDPTQMVDFASWGNGAGVFNTRIDVAVAAGLWPNLTTHLTVPPEGHSLASFGQGTGPASWFADSTPTLGGPNQPARFATFGNGCPGTFGVPTLGTDPAAPLPWLGEPFRVVVGNLPPVALNFVFLATGFTETPPISLAFLGMPGCNSYLTPAVTLLLTGGMTTITFPFLFPANPAFQGIAFVQQAAVSDVNANPTGLVVTPPARAATGLR